MTSRQSERAAQLRRSPRAFTLLELLLAIAISAVVMSAIMFVFYSALKLRNRSQEAVDRSLPLQQALAVIKRDLSNLVPPSGVLSGALQSTPTYSTIGSAMGTSSSRNRGNGPDFYTASGFVDDTGPWGDIQRVSYFLAAPTNNVPGQDLYRSVARNLLPQNQYTSDDQYLMSGVEQITFQYYDGNNWKDSWDSTTADQTTGLTNNLPLAIKVQLRLHSEGRAANSLAPVELVVPVPVQARTNAPVEIAGVTP